MLFTVCIHNADSQNLVKNPSFEHFVNCPQKLGNLDNDMVDWVTPTKGSTDYFNGCSQAMGTPKNFNGEQPANFGVGYVGFYFYAPEDYREYLEGVLNQKLIKDETYTVSFYVSLAERSDFAIKEFGVQFTENPVKVDTRKTLSRRHLSKISGDVSNYFEIKYSDFYSDKKEWVKVKKEFVAKGTENYIIIGNFKNNARTQKFRTKRNVTKGSYYYVDMIAVVPSNPKIHIGTGLLADGKSFQLGSIHTFKNMLFLFDNFELLSKSKTELDEIEAYLSLHKNLKIQISGHTDVIGNSAYNKKLSENRAKAVAFYLMEKGIDSARISYHGFGSEKPVMQNATSTGRQSNRRVEFRIKD
jgi:outer membrane protein OmpA-like peptidoglycan-associated protein